MLEEVDFRREAQHIAQFAGYLDRAGLRRVATCPSVYRQFSTQRVMVMDRLRGVPLTDLDAVRSITTGTRARRLSCHAMPVADRPAVQAPRSLPTIVDDR